MGNSFFIAKQDGLLDVAVVKRAAQSLAPVRDVSELSPVYQYDLDYCVEEDATTIRIEREGKFISVEGCGPASLQAVTHLVRSIPHEVMLFDEAYSFCIRLSGNISPDQIVTAFDSGRYDEM